MFVGFNYSSNPLLKVFFSFYHLAAPKNISGFWSFGSMLGLCLVTQIATGLFLAMHFVADASLSFDSAVHISRDVNFGWLIRGIHANGASMFFVCMYFHVGRGLYYKSFKKVHTWMIGVTLLFLTILTAFMGYVLPWGQMSYWAATVITNLLSAVPYFGVDVVLWVWGGYSVSSPTLTRFYAFHFVFPFVIAALSVVHLVYLHEGGSNNPLGVSSSNDPIKFMPYFGVKDLVGFFLMWFALGLVVLFYPYILVDPENFIPANALVTPVHIQPEWYFLPMYAVLRSIPNKMGGVVALVFSIGVLYFFPLSRDSSSSSFSVFVQLLFWLFVSSFFVLMFIGSKPVEYPYEFVGQVFTLLYFLVVLVLLF